MKLQDIYWQEGAICFAASKHGNALRFPLHQEVAEALLSYIKDRMQTEFQEVFLTITDPKRPLSKHNHYYTSLTKYYLKAGISSSSKGSRVLRHAFATRLVNQNISIKTISDLLGHRWIETTFIHTKVDVGKLRELARDWPEVM